MPLQQVLDREAIFLGGDNVGEQTHDFYASGVDFFGGI